MLINGNKDSFSRKSKKKNFHQKLFMKGLKGEQFRVIGS